MGLVFVTRELLDNWDEVAAVLSGANPLVLVGALVVGILSMTTIGLAWRRCLEILGASLPLRLVLRGYFVGQLGKYVPGGIWPVVGRAEMARREGIPGGAAYASTALSMALTYIAAALVAISALVSGAVAGTSTWWPILAVLILGVLALHPFFVERLLALIERIGKRELSIPVPSWTESIALLLRHVPAWLGISTATWLVALTLDTTAPDFRNIVYATCLAWFVGFVAVGVPGGIGVREAVFLAAAVSLSSPGVAVAVTVVARVVFIFVDLTGAALATLAAGFKRPTRPIEPENPPLPED